MWIYVPPDSLTSLCSQEEKVSDSPSDWLLPLLEQSATLSATPTLAPSWQRAWKTKPWIPLLFSRTLEPLMAAFGVERWLCSLADFPVKTSAPQESAQELMEKRADSGASMQDSFARYDPTTSLWKTSRPCLFEGLDEFSETWPTSGMMRSGTAFRRKTWERPTSESDFSSSPIDPTLTRWPTPCAHDDQKSPEAHLAMKARMGGGRKTITDLTVAVKAWPTPTANFQNRTKGDDPKRSDGIQTAATSRAWPTPRVSSINGPSENEILAGNPKKRIETEAHLWAEKREKQWPTPRASSAENRTTQRAPSHGKSHGKLLAAEACEAMTTIGKDRSGTSPLWATPTVHGNDNRKGLSPTSGDGLQTQAISHSSLLAPIAPSGETSSPEGPTLRPQLNPNFVEYLMGWPQGWTKTTPLAWSDYASWEMASCHWLARWRSQSFARGQERDEAPNE